jgi:hypothetical protein
MSKLVLKGINAQSVTTNSSRLYNHKGIVRALNIDNKQVARVNVL